MKDDDTILSAVEGHDDLVGLVPLEAFLDCR